MSNSKEPKKGEGKTVAPNSFAINTNKRGVIVLIDGFKVPAGEKVKIPHHVANHPLTKASPGLVLEAEQEPELETKPAEALETKPAEALETKPAEALETKPSEAAKKPEKASTQKKPEPKKG